MSKANTVHAKSSVLRMRGVWFTSSHNYDSCLSKQPCMYDKVCIASSVGKHSKLHVEVCMCLCDCVLVQM